MKVLLHPTYFPSISTFALIAQRDIVWEFHDNFQKQTYRNRCYICTDQGKQMMNIPIKHVGETQGRQLYREVVVAHNSLWQKQHWRTLETAYRTSPYFEFYEDEIAPIFQTTVNLLFEFNLMAMGVILDCLGIERNFGKTTSYEPSTEHFIDARDLVLAKKPLKTKEREYTQVFMERHGFIANLSILDLLFNEGPNTLSYLLDHPLDFF